MLFNLQILVSNKLLLRSMRDGCVLYTTLIVFNIKDIKVVFILPISLRIILHYVIGKSPFILNIISNKET